MEALDLVRVAMRSRSFDPELRYLLALGFTRMGVDDRAGDVLGRLPPVRELAPKLAIEIESLRAHLTKNRYATNPQDTRAARAARDAYLAVNALQVDPYPTINAATLSLLAGEPDRARQLARDAIRLTGDPRDHWGAATLGEASLLLGEHANARDWYARARRLARNRFGDVARMRTHVAWLRRAIPEAQGVLDLLAAPTVLAFSGHMIDTADRSDARFPPDREGEVRSAIDGFVTRHVPLVGYSSGACGGDILFAEAVLARRQELTLVLPFALPDFIASSVAFAGKAWVDRFEVVLARASKVVYATEERFLGDTLLFEHANELLCGLAQLRAAQLDTKPLLLALMDPATLPSRGGTAAMARDWRGEVCCIPLRAAGADAGATESPQRAASSCVHAGRVVRALLFADVRGYSNLPEEYSPHFATVFLGTVRRLLDTHGAVVSASTWGDGLFLVFETCARCAEFALALHDAIGGIDWEGMGLAPDTQVRIALHAGPVFETFDPVVERHTFFGTHVVRTARLEPIVVPGSIFVTEAFAAVLAATDPVAFACDYIGRYALAKSFGEMPVYRLRRKGLPAAQGHAAETIA